MVHSNRVSRGTEGLFGFGRSRRPMEQCFVERVDCEERGLGPSLSVQAARTAAAT